RSSDGNGLLGHLLDFAADLLVQRLTTNGAQCRPDCRRGEQWRCKQTDDKADTPGSTFLNRVVGLLQRHVALKVLAYNHCAPEAFATVEDGLVVLVRGLSRQVATDEDVGCLVIDLH